MAGYEFTENTTLTNTEYIQTGSYNVMSGTYYYNLVYRSYVLNYKNKYNFVFRYAGTTSTATRFLYVVSDKNITSSLDPNYQLIQFTDFLIQRDNSFILLNYQDVSETEINIIVTRTYSLSSTYQLSQAFFESVVMNFTINEDQTLTYNGKTRSYLLSVDQINQININLAASSSNRSSIYYACVKNFYDQDNNKLVMILNADGYQKINDNSTDFLKIEIDLNTNLYQKNIYDYSNFDTIKKNDPSEILNNIINFNSYDYIYHKNNFKINDDYFIHCTNLTSQKNLICRVNFQKNEIKYYEISDFINSTGSEYFTINHNKDDNYFYCALTDKKILSIDSINTSQYYNNTYNLQYFVKKYNYDDLFLSNDYNILQSIEDNTYNYKYYSNYTYLENDELNNNKNLPVFDIEFVDEEKSLFFLFNTNSIIVLNKKFEIVYEIQEYSESYISNTYGQSNAISMTPRIVGNYIDEGEIFVTLGNNPPSVSSELFDSFLYTFENIEEIPDVLPDEDPDITLPDDTTEEDGYEVVNFKKYDLFLFNNDTSNNYLTQKIKFSTDEIRSYNGKTQVINLRQNPLMSIDVDFTLSKFKKQQFKNFLTYNFEKPFLFPMFNNKVKHTSTINNDENSVEVFFNDDFVDFEFFNNDAVLFYKNEKEYFLRNIKYVKQNSIILQDYIPKTASAGYFDVIPLKLVKIDKSQNITLTNLNQNILQATLSLKYVINDKDVIKNTYTDLIFNEETETYDPNEVFVDLNEENFSKYNNKFFIDDKLIDFDSKQTRTIIKDVEVFKNENYGIEEEFLVNDFNFDEIDNIKFYLNSRNKIIDFKRFLFEIKGNQKSFYLPSFEEECEVVKLMTNNIIAIKRNDFDKILEKNDSNHIVIYNKKGEKMITEILSYQQKYNASLSLQVTELTLKDDIVNFIESDFKKIDRINYLNEVVFSDNETTFDFEKDDFCVIIKKVKRIKNVD